MLNKIFQKFRTFRIVEKDTDCRNTVAMEDSSSLKGFNPIIHSSALGFMAMFGKWRFGRAETSSMLWHQRNDTGGKNSASRGHRLVCLCLGSWKKKNLSQIRVTTSLFPCRFVVGIQVICMYQKANKIN